MPQSRSKSAFTPPPATLSKELSPNPPPTCSPSEADARWPSLRCFTDSAGGAGIGAVLATWPAPPFFPPCPCVPCFAAVCLWLLPMSPEGAGLRCKGSNKVQKL
eukprot:TRINITY_DN25795_c0_g1_i1.p1 TRINITY_DN25795_c0_g1~~TRINITY_DN25795_c0_g1_i1.p1  ORF type:complete len:119 (-),score=4.37 TRINITY_DN25795_c0_g1_i1:7-318(-)